MWPLCAVTRTIIAKYDTDFCFSPHYFPFKEIKIRFAYLFKDCFQFLQTNFVAVYASLTMKWCMKRRVPKLVMQA